jgi:recombination protein RecT
MPDDAKTADAPGTSVARPQLAQPQANKKKTIIDVLNAPDQKQRFMAVVPRHLSVERMLRVMAMAVHKTPRLGECEMLSLLGAMLACASLGLEPNTPLGEAHLIPFQKRYKDQADNKWKSRYEVNLIIGYRGYINLARRSGSLVSIHADVVYEGDDFEFEYGSNMHLLHRPSGARGNRAPTYAYAHAKLADGEAFEVLPYDEILSIRNSTQAFQQALRDKAKAEEENDDRANRAYESSPWVAFEHEMAAKTMVRRLSKWLSMSIEFANAARLDAMGDTGKVDYRAFATDKNALVDVEIAQIEDASGGDDEIVDQQTGEVTTKKGGKKTTEATGEKAQADPQAGKPAADAKPTPQRAEAGTGQTAAPSSAPASQQAGPFGE